MKLLRLKLNEEFRSLPAGFEIHFLRDWEFDQMQEFGPYCLAGRNGSGKSNVMEALAAIFYHLDCIDIETSDGFRFSEDDESNQKTQKGFRAEKCTPDSFQLEYLMPVIDEKGEIASIGRAIIQKAAGKPPTFHWNDRYNAKSEDFKILEKEDRRDKFPRYIVGYSSGENEVLSLPFFKMRFLHFDEYNDALKNETGYNFKGKPEGRLVYLDSQFSQAILLCSFLIPKEKNTEMDTTLKIFREIIQIEKVEEFRIIIRQQVDADYSVLLNLSEPDRENEEKTKRPITQYLDTEIDKLRNCATCWYKEDDTLTLDYLVNDATSEAFRHYFGDALNLFKRFQMLITLNLYSVSDQAKKDLYRSESLYVNETVPVLASDERVMRFKEVFTRKKGVTDPILLKSLSDGEHQFLHTIGLCLLFRDENALFLLDEPETHLNPDWRARYVSTLRDCLKDSKGMRDILLTSHSPFVVSDCQQEKVLVFEKVKDEKSGKYWATYKRPDFKTFGASVSQITIKVFGKIETIGRTAQDVIEDLYRRFEAGEPANDLIQESHLLLGDSVEKVIFINRLLDASEK